MAVSRARQLLAVVEEVEEEIVDLSVGFLTVS